MKIEFKPIGYIRSPFKNREDIPRQSVLASDKEAIIEILPEFEKGLLGLKEGENIVVFFNFHKSDSYDLRFKSHSTGDEIGVFASRSPNRPNGIGQSIVLLEKIEGNKLYIKGVDMLDETPLLDIKPYSRGLNPKENQD